MLSLSDAEAIQAALDQPLASDLHDILKKRLDQNGDNCDDRRRA